MMLKILLIYLLIINIIAFLLCAVDKRRAIRGAWRISERCLILSAVIGGSIGLWVGMYICHHKTKHAKFVLGVPVIIICQVILAFLIIKCGNI